MARERKLYEKQKKIDDDRQAQIDEYCKDMEFDQITKNQDAELKKLEALSKSREN